MKWDDQKNEEVVNIPNINLEFMTNQIYIVPNIGIFKRNMKDI